MVNEFETYETDIEEVDKAMQKREREKKIKDAQDALRVIVDICEQNKADCEYCPFFSAKMGCCCFDDTAPYNLRVEDEPIVRVVL